MKEKKTLIELLFMKIAVISSGILPVPAVQGGAVENLIDYYLEYNERHKLHDITVFSVWHPNVVNHSSLKSESNHYIYIKNRSLSFRIRAKIYGLFSKNCYYYYQLEYFFVYVIRKLMRSKYDLIILENRPAVAIRISECCQTPIISHIHTNLVNPSTPQIESIIKSTNKFIVVSDFLKQEIRRTGVGTDIETVYNGLNSKLFNKKGDFFISRATLGFPNGDFVAIYTGRIVPKKGVKELLLAFQLLSDFPDIKLLVVGGDNFGDSVKSNVFLDELHEMSKRMDGKVVFTGYVPYDELPGYLGIADVAVIPSCIDEAFGMTCIEATAMGLPVIATKDGGIPEALVGQKHILLSKDDNLPQSIADAILEIRNHYKLYKGNGLNPMFTKEKYAEHFFQSLILSW